MTTLSLRTNLDNSSVDNYIADLKVELEKMKYEISFSNHIASNSQVYLLTDIIEYLDKTKANKLEVNGKPVEKN